MERLKLEHASALAMLFSEFHLAGYEAHFHPHPMDQSTAASICAKTGKDYYCCAWDGQAALSYGFLRGYDQGHSIPTLGIAVSPARLGLGLARYMMHHLHAE